MAIKGKKKGGQKVSRGAPAAPRPKIEPRKQPLLRRSGIRRGAVATLALLALWGATFTYGRVTRADDLRAYDRKLLDAKRSFLAHSAADAQSSIITIPRQFATKKISPQALLASAEEWKADFAKARDAVRALKPVDELRSANGIIANGIQEYADIAGLYAAVAQERQLEDVVDTKKEKDKIEAHVQLQLTHLQEMLTNAQSTVDSGMAEVGALKLAWGVKSAQPAAPAGVTGS